MTTQYSSGRSGSSGTLLAVLLFTPALTLAQTVPPVITDESISTPEPIPTTSVLDNFTRADEDPLSDAGNWDGLIYTTSYGKRMAVVSDQATSAP